MLCVKVLPACGELVGIPEATNTPTERIQEVSRKENQKLPQDLSEEDVFQKYQIKLHNLSAFIDTDGIMRSALVNSVSEISPVLSALILAITWRS